VGERLRDLSEVWSLAHPSPLRSADLKPVLTETVNEDVVEGVYHNVGDLDAWSASGRSLALPGDVRHYGADVILDNVRLIVKVKDAPPTKERGNG